MSFRHLHFQPLRLTNAEIRAWKTFGDYLEDLKKKKNQQKENDGRLVLWSGRVAEL